jgi:hypothetical protein
MEAPASDNIILRRHARHMYYFSIEIAFKKQGTTICVQSQQGQQPTNNYLRFAHCLWSGSDHVGDVTLSGNAATLPGE